MDKDTLIALGTVQNITITDEFAEAIIAAHKSELDNKFIPKTRFDEVNEKNKTLITQLSERDDSIKELKKGLENKVDQDKVNDIQKQLDLKDKEHEIVLGNKNKEIKVINAIAGTVHDNELIVGMLNLDNITINEDGSTIGLNEQIEGLKQSKGFLFKDDKPSPSVTPEMSKTEAPVNPAQGMKSPNVAPQPNSGVVPNDKNNDQVNAIIGRMVAKQNLNRSKGE